MQRHEVISRAMLKAKGGRVPEFFGLAEADFREPIVLAHHCEKELGLSMSALAPLGSDHQSGARLELTAKSGHTYSVRLTPYNGATLDAGSGHGQMQQVFRHHSFDHRSAGELFRTIKAQEKQKPWLT